MNTEQIAEGNALIAEFEGRKFFPRKDNHSFDEGFFSYAKCLEFIADHKLKGYTPQLGWELGTGKYHSSWDWLMPVVKKIQQLKIAEFTNKKPVMAAIMDVEIESLWNSVVVFIKWYNQQNINK